MSWGHSRFGRICTLFLATMIWGVPVLADGPVGDHVNELQDHLDEYGEEVSWLIEQVDGIVTTYEKKGAKQAQPEKVVDHWEAVKFHSAIESNYVPLYANIWQGLFGVRQAIENKQSIDKVRAEQRQLEQALWQSLGAVKVAAQYQDQGLLQAVATREAVTPSRVLIEIKQRLDRVVAKYAERLTEDAVSIIQETYATRFESVEDVLKSLNPDLVEDIESDFHVHLPKAISSGASVDEIRDVVGRMQDKLDQGRALLKATER
ncbi:MAG: hypothetical protein AAF525_11715 [Pseudomonadota bacterium]